MEKNIYSKIFKLQQEIGSISKSNENPFYKSKYYRSLALYATFSICSLIAIIIRDSTAQKAVTQLLYREKL